MKRNERLLHTAHESQKGYAERRKPSQIVTDYMTAPKDLLRKAKPWGWRPGQWFPGVRRVGRV